MRFCILPLLLLLSTLNVRCSRVTVAAVLLKALNGCIYTKRALLSAAAVLAAICTHSDVTLIFYYSLHLLQSGNNHKQQKKKKSSGEPAGVALSTPIRHRRAAANLSRRTWRSGVTETFEVACSTRTHAEGTHAFLLLLLSDANNSSRCRSTLWNLCVSSVSVEIVGVASNLFL